MLCAARFAAGLAFLFRKEKHSTYKKKKKTLQTAAGRVKVQPLRLRPPS